MKRVWCSLMLLLLCSVLNAQHLNKPAATLSVNATGLIDSSNSAIRTNSEVTPVPVTSGIFHHRAAPKSSLEIRVDGAAFASVLLLAGTYTTVPTWYGGNLNPAQILVDGYTPMTLVDYTATTGLDGSWRLVLPNGLPLGMPDFTLQAIVVDLGSPTPINYSAALTVETNASLQTGTRNLFDSLNHLVDNPNYYLSLCSTSMLQNGRDRIGFMTQFLPRSNDFRIENIAPILATSPPLPLGPPSPGQIVSPMIQFVSHEGQHGSPATPVNERERLYDVQIAEEGGVWKFHGNQLEFEIDARLNFRPNTTNAQGFSPQIVFEVNAEHGVHGTISSVALTGPQLNAVNVNGTAVDSLPGTQAMYVTQFDSDYSEWRFEVELANSLVGTSVMPLVVDNTGIRDAYSFVVTWSDSTTTGPYSIALRSSLDPAANPAAVLAAIPSVVAPNPVLSNAGTSAAAVDLQIQFGTSLTAAEFGYLEVAFQQGALDLEIQPLFPLYTPGASQSLNLSTPFLVFGATFYILSTADAEGVNYYRLGSVNL